MGIPLCVICCFSLTAFNICSLCLIIINEAEREKMRIKRHEENLRDLWDDVKCPNIRIIEVPEEEGKKKGREKILEEIIVENLPKMGKEIATQVHESQRVPNWINLRINTPRHILIIHLLIGLFHHLILSSTCSLCILDIKLLSDASFANVFSCSQGCVFVLFMVSLLYKNILKCLLIYLAPADLSCCTWDPLYIIQDLLLQSTESLVVARRLDGRVARASEHVGSGVVAPAFLF